MPLVQLCEDEKVMIRIHAIRGLELICKNNPSTVRRIAEMLGQLLVSEEKLELAAVKATFTSLFAIDPQAAFLALFTLVSTGVDANLRSKGLEFLIAQLKAMQGALRKDEAVAAGLCAGLKAMLAGAQNAIIGREDLKFLVQTLISLCPHGNNAAKIKADEALKAELANIALTQSGLAGGALDLNNEAALRHFLAVQSIVANLANNYAIDTAPFQQLYFAQLLPNLELIQSTELRTQLLRAVANGASKIQPKQAQSFFPSFYAQFKKHVPGGEIVAKAPPAPAAAAAAPPAAPAADGDAMTDAAVSESSAAASSTSAPSSSVNFAFAEVFVYLFHILASQAPSQLRAATGIFTPTGQPGDFDAAPGALRDEFNNRVQFLLQQNAAYKEQLHTVQRKIQDEIKAFNKKNQAARAAAKPAAAAAAVSPAAAGQPVVEKKEADAAPAAAAAPAGVADESALISTLRSKLQSVNFAIRIAGSIAMLAKPLLDKPLPTLMAADKMGLSWREFKANDNKAAQGKQPVGQQQQQKGAKGQQQSQSQQKGQKRKSGGGDAQSSNKKQSQGAASNKKQSGGQQQQQQQQGQANKKQRQSASNKGGNQNNGGGRRRR